MEKLLSGKFFVPPHITVLQFGMCRQPEIKNLDGRKRTYIPFTSLKFGIKNLVAVTNKHEMVIPEGITTS
jgi:hypothetical protein